MKNGKNQQPELFDIYETEILPEQEKSDYVEAARAWARDFGADGRLVTVNDVRNNFGPPPPEKDPRIMGSIFRGDEWQLVKRDRTPRIVCHNRPIGFFRLRGTSPFPCFLSNEA